MRKLILLLLILPLFTSCSSDDNNTKTQEYTKSDILGSWYSGSFWIEFGGSTLSNGQYTFIFRDDNTCTYKYYEESTNGTYTVLDNVVRISLPNETKDMIIYGKPNNNTLYLQGFIRLSPDHGTTAIYICNKIDN